MMGKAGELNIRLESMKVGGARRKLRWLRCIFANGIVKT
jgi:hypothetical protein